jgi:hypothetical protein
MSVIYRLLPIAVLCLPLLADDAILEHARQVNLERAAHMPNNVADEVVTGDLDRKGSGKWERFPTVIEDEINSERKPDQPGEFSPEWKAVGRNRRENPEARLHTGHSCHRLRRRAATAVRSELPHHTEICW